MQHFEMLAIATDFHHWMGIARMERENLPPTTGAYQLTSDGVGGGHTSDRLVNEVEEAFQQETRLHEEHERTSEFIFSSYLSLESMKLRFIRTPFLSMCIIHNIL